MFFMVCFVVASAVGGKGSSTHGDLRCVALLADFFGVFEVDGAVFPLGGGG